jgi:hypothetical protein
MLAWALGLVVVIFASAALAWAVWGFTRRQPVDDQWEDSVPTMDLTDALAHLHSAGPNASEAQLPPAPSLTLHVRTPRPHSREEKPRSAPPRA